VAKPWGSYDVVGLFNYDGQPAEKVLELGRLKLEAEEVHVFEYWSSRYLGKVSRETGIPRRLAAYEGQVFAVVPAVEDRPLLISTSRHVTQGALDVDELVWKQDGQKWLATGTSSHLVAADPYELVFVAGRYRVAAVKSSAPAKTLHDGTLARVRITPEKSGQARWEVSFEPITGPHLAVSPVALDVLQGAQGRLEIQSLGPQGTKFTIRASDPAVKVTPAEGEVGPWPAKAEVLVSTELKPLEAGSEVGFRLVIEAPASRQPPQEVELRVHAPPPENLALRAKATASSAWNGQYQASQANDGNEGTRWNSRQGDVSGAWLELAWPQPVEFNRVEIDECVDFGPRIQAWRLEADRDKPIELARGTTAGRHHLLKLPQTVKAERLRLTIERASVVPTIWEFRVYHAR
jgi:hypothetical protein